METGRGAVRFLAILVGVNVASIAFGAAGLFLAGAIGDAVNPNFGYEFEGMEWLLPGALAGAGLGALLSGASGKSRLH